MLTQTQILKKMKIGKGMYVFDIIKSKINAIKHFKLLNISKKNTFSMFDILSLMLRAYLYNAGHNAERINLICMWTEN